MAQGAADSPDCIERHPTQHDRLQPNREVLFNGRQYRIHLPALRNTAKLNFHEDIANKKQSKKAAMETYADKKAYIKPSILQIGDWVMYRQEQQRKNDPPYCGTPHQIVSIQGNRIKAAYYSYWSQNYSPQHLLQKDTELSSGIQAADLSSWSF